MAIWFGIIAWIAWFDEFGKKSRACVFQVKYLVFTRSCICQDSPLHYQPLGVDSKEVPDGVDGRLLIYVSVFQDVPPPITCMSGFRGVLLLTSMVSFEACYCSRKRS